MIREIEKSKLDASLVKFKKFNINDNKLLCEYSCIHGGLIFYIVKTAYNETLFVNFTLEKYYPDSSIDSKSSYRYVCRCDVTNEEIPLEKILTIAKIYDETE